SNRGAFVVRLSSADIKEISGLRVLIEGDLVLHAVPQLTKADLTAIREAERAARRSSMSAAWIEDDRAFHQALYSPAARPRQMALAMSLRSELERYVSIYSRLPEQRRQWLRDHRRILDAFVAREAAEAHDALIQHIHAAGQFLAKRAEEDTDVQ